MAKLTTANTVCSYGKHFEMPPAIVETSDNATTNSSVLSSEHNRKREREERIGRKNYGRGNNNVKRLLQQMETVNCANIYVQPQAPSISRRSVSQSVSHLVSK